MENLNNAVALSVIVPVYKVEKYINECVDSLVNQTMKNIEIILVDDGSPDNCPAICDEYAKRYDNVKVIHRENGGLVSARKTGFRCCCGEYVTFVDGDDWVKRGYYEEIIALIEQYNPDIFYTTKYYEAKNQEEYCICNQCTYSGLYNRSMLEKEVFPETLYRPPFFTFGIVPSVWSKIIKRQFLTDFMLNVPEEIKTGEDLAITLPCMLKADSIYFSNICGYYYRQNPTSITHSFDSTAPMRIDSLLNYLRKTTEAYDKYNIKSQISIYAMHILQFTVTSLIKGSNNMRSDLKLMKPLWYNPSVKEGLKSKAPLKVKLLILAAKLRQVLLLKVLKKRWTKSKEVKA